MTSGVDKTPATAVESSSVPAWHGLSELTAAPYLRASGVNRGWKVPMGKYRLRVLGGLQLTTDGAGVERRIEVQPKPLSLLAFVAVCGREMAVRRDTILALFWPELAAEQARVVLRQALFHLRHAIGEEIVTARVDDTVTLARDVCSCDAVELEEALARGDTASVAALYAGPLLDGVHVKGAASELEQRLDSERKRLASVASEAMWALASACEEHGDTLGVAHWVHRAITLSPDDEDVARRAALLLERVGARAAARGVLSAYVRRLATEYDAEPGDETREMLSRLEGPASASRLLPGSSRRKPTSSFDLAATSDSPGSTHATVVAAPPVGRAQPWVRRTALVAAVFVLLGVLEISVLFWPGLRGARVALGSGADDAEVVSRSAVARRLYEEGMDRFRANRYEEASQLFRSALRDDSTCAACARRAGEALLVIRQSQARTLLHDATERAGRAPWREQLLSRFMWEVASDDPRQLAVSDTLAIRLPTDVEAQLARANALAAASRPLEALPILRRLTAADRAESSAPAGVDRLAENAWWMLVGTLWNADSVSAATQAAREWTVRHPRDENGWSHLVDALAREERFGQAQATLARLPARPPNDGGVVLTRARLAIREGQYDLAERLLVPLEGPGIGERSSALWWHSIALRNEGRQREALRLAGELRGAGDTDARYTADMIEGQSLFELGRIGEAADRFRSFAAQVEPDDSGLTASIARRRAWRLTHAGTALAAEGDTVALRALIDTVAAVGARSGFARDPRLHHYLRGLLWCTRGQADSAEIALRASLTSWSEGFTRENAELAALLIHRHRTSEAIPLVRLALRGPMEASNAYITRTELQALLARAYAAAGEPDSAAVYRAATQRAWRGERAPPSLVCGTAAVARRSR